MAGSVAIQAGIDGPHNAMRLPLRRNRRSRTRIAENSGRLRRGRFGEQFRGWIEGELAYRIALPADIQAVLPKRRRAPETVSRACEALPDLAIVARVELAHVGCVDD